MRLSALRFVAPAIGIICAAAACVRAQTPTAGRGTPADSVFARARQLVVTGNGAAGRVLVDSVVAATSPDAPAYADALYWRATLAASSADAERDYRRIVVEYPLSPREGDALFQLAQLEVARGDRAAAATHLERFITENPSSADAGRAELLLVRVSFEQNDLVHGCIALTSALRGVPDSAVELHNQLAYYSPRCEGVDTTRKAVGASNALPLGVFSPPGSATAVTPRVSARDSANRNNISGDSASRDTAASASKAPASKAKSTGRYTLQVAAYTSRAEAERLAKKLKGRGIDARVVGTAKLFRVRVGRFETRAAAAAEAKTLKAKKIAAFVTDAGADDR